MAAPCPLLGDGITDGTRLNFVGCSIEGNHKFWGWISEGRVQSSAVPGVGGGNPYQGNGESANAAVLP